MRWITASRTCSGVSSPVVSVRANWNCTMSKRPWAASTPIVSSRRKGIGKASRDHTSANCWSMTSTPTAKPISNITENEESSIAGNPAAPTFNALARRYATLTQYDAVAHPSLPNYLALVSGSTQGISSDCTDCVVGARSLADTLAAAGKTWKTYAEGLPYPGFTGASDGRYAKKHDPFLYFRDVADSRARRDRVVPLTRLPRDLARHRLPDFSLVIPNLCGDMHDCSVATGDAWLKGHVVPLLRSPALRGGVVFVVFDEGTSDTGGGGRVDALALGPTVRRGSRFGKPTNH